MPLDPVPLQAGIAAAFALGIVPPPGNADSDTIATAIAAAYDVYAKLGQSCAAVSPSLVQLPDLLDKLKLAMSDTGATAEDAAADWKDAFDAYWEGALFGATGAVVEVTGSAALESGLAGVFANTANTLVVAAAAIAAQLDTYTKTVMVTDTALPAPSGCGPSAIS